MDSRRGNPFLIDEHSTSPSIVTFNQPSNPFLQDPNDAQPTLASVGENPFLNLSSDQSLQQSLASTNPFATFPTETGHFRDELGSKVNETVFADVLHSQIDIASTHIFDDEKMQIPDTLSSGLENSEVPVKIIYNETPLPSRPPPPKPVLSLSSRNTKDLILSVTGAMDATSNQMLDRLQNTRTPSPTLMHSPSPTPEHSVADLLDVDNNVPDIHDDMCKVITITERHDCLDIFKGEQLEPTLGITVDTELSTTDPFRIPKLQENIFTRLPNKVLFAVHDSILENTEHVISEKIISNISCSTESENSHAGAESSVPDFSTSNTARLNIDMDTNDTLSTVVLEENVTPLSDVLSTHLKLLTEDTNLPSVPEIEDGRSGELEIQSDTFTTVSQKNVGDRSFSNIHETVYKSQTGNSVIYHHSYFKDSSSEFPENNAYFSNGMNQFSTTRGKAADTFDVFASKFDKAAELLNTIKGSIGDPFASDSIAMDTSSDVWGDSTAAGSETTTTGFGESDGFDSFLSMTAPPREVPFERTESGESDECPDFSVYIKPKETDQMHTVESDPVPIIAPPPKSPQNSAYSDAPLRFNPFDKSGSIAQDVIIPTAITQAGITRTDSEETPPTPLFDEDVSQPLEDFPRVTYAGDGWEMQLRQPNKKKITGQRFWKKIFVRLVYQGDNPVVQLLHSRDDKDPFQELPLLPCYSVSDIGAQQFDQYGKIFTVKVQYIFYKERPGVRPGQVTKAERLTNKLSQFAAYAIQGDYQGVKEFGSDLKKLGLPVEHAPQVSQLFKLGSQNYEDMKEFSSAIEEALFTLPAHRDRALQYKMEEVQIAVVDELYVEQTAEGHVEKQIARVRLFFLGFLSGMPDVELGINDMRRQGKEVVGRHDIIPVVTEEWIRLENVEFHSCIQQDEYEDSRIIRFKPPDACYIELMRFRVRPPKNRELPLQLKCVICVTGNKVDIRADILVPGFASRKLGQIPCEDVMVRIPIPECWIYLFRVEKHFRYGSVKSAHRRTGKIKGIERFLGAVDNLEPQLMEATSGQAKYEHQHKAIVWRMPRLPKEGQGAYTTHQLVCRLALTSYDQIPVNLAKYCYVEFTMPATQVSHTTARSVSFRNHDSDDPPEKYVRNLSRHEYRVGIEHTKGDGPNAYISATISKKIPENTPELEEIPVVPADSDSDSSE